LPLLCRAHPGRPAAGSGRRRAGRCRGPRPAGGLPSAPLPVTSLQANGAAAAAPGPAACRRGTIGPLCACPVRPEVIGNAAASALLSWPALASTLNDPGRADGNQHVQRRFGLPVKILPYLNRDCDIEHLASRAVLKNTMSVSSGDFTRCLGLRTAQHPCRSLAANGAAILSLNSGNPRPACPSTRR